MSYKIAVVGATGNVGREMIAILAEREIPQKRVVALASERSIGTEISYGEDQELRLQALDKFDFSSVDVALFALNDQEAAVYVPKALTAGCLVIDNSSYYRQHPDVPLIVPEVNGEVLEGYSGRLIANPNCSAAQLVMALAPLHRISPIKRVVVSTYQSVSGAGRVAMEELFNQTRDVYVNNPVHKEVFTKQIAFNVIPHIGAFNEEGATGEETKISQETRKILDPDIAVTATCVRVPVFIGHSQAVAIEFMTPLSVEEAQKALSQVAGIAVVSYNVDEGYVTPLECVGYDKVYVSRLRNDPTVEYGLWMWIVADNLRKGAALNAVQIMELSMS